MINQVFNEDCLEGMKRIPDKSIDMILCDPPYGNMNMGGVTHGMSGRVEWDISINPVEMFKLYNKVLRPNGCVCIFSQEPYTTEVIRSAHGSIPYSYKYVWIKDHFANALNSKKAPLMYTEDVVVFFKAFDDFTGHPLKSWFDEELAKCGFNKSELIKLIGSSASHYFTNGRQFSIPSKNNHKLMVEKTGAFVMDYELMKNIDREFRELQKCRYKKVFNLPDGKRYKSNILTYKKDYGGLHPTQKPISLLEDLIMTYTNEGETVLDNCMGSGTTAIACINTNRNYIGFEKEEKYYNTILDRIAKHTQQLKLIA